jgi:hypothetical protein
MKIIDVEAMVLDTGRDYADPQAPIEAHGVRFAALGHRRPAVVWRVLLLYRSASRISPRRDNLGPHLGSL